MSATEDFVAGVQNPRTPWQEATVASAANQAAGIQQAITEKRFEKGVQKAGNSKWQSKTISKGTQRFAPGIQDAKSDYQTAMAPVLAKIESTTLPPRYPKGDPRNIARVSAIAQSLRQLKGK
jgi:hypothetical protein